ncbi:MAG: ISL3 family transposase [Sediminibacterium sp.]
MSLDELLFEGPEKFLVIGCERTPSGVVVEVNSCGSCNYCPACFHKTSSVHSYYYRTVMDLPILGYQTTIKLRARKFRCLNDECDRKIFTERFDKYVQKGKRLSARLRMRIEKIAFHAGGNGGARLCKVMGMPVSGSTLIRCIYQHRVPVSSTPRVLGIDDWAFKKRLSYGTVLVDIEQRKIIDLLPDREGETVKKWLLAHPGVSVVTRDRYSQFANGVQRASGSIVHVADRWHLIKNLGDAVQKLIDRNYMRLKANRRSINEGVMPEPQPPVEIPVIEDSAWHGKMRKKFAEVKLMLAQGYSLSHISRTLSVERRTIRKWREYHVLPAKKVPTATNMFLYEDKVRELLKSNPKIETKQIWAEIRLLGYNASHTTAYEQIGKIRGSGTKVKVNKAPDIFWIPSRTSRLLYKSNEQLTSKERAAVENLCSSCEEIRIAAELVNDFREMLQNKAGELLKHWISRAIRMGVKELKSFARGMLSDFDAVKNGIELPWSNGPVEGQVNKLKMIKRQMYGRAGFELLRRRMIYQEIN